uniref:Uncharacterized protein n=1 Tax=viral metagenome TaxID=1070528 RepID=A0A6M3L5R2_9ZZZZ
MSYIGKTFSIPCNRGGLTANPNIDMIEPTDMIYPTRNINLHENGRKKRGGTTSLLATGYGTVVTGTPAITGMYDFMLIGGTRTLVVAADDGSVYSGFATTIHTGASTTTFFDFETFEDELYIVDGNTVPVKWTGTGNVAALTDIPSDWTGTNFPSWIAKHGRGASERLWAGGCPSTPNTVYASVNGDGDDFSDANVTTIQIETGDGFGIVGAEEYGDRLVCFGKRKNYIIDDLDTNVSNWGYDAAQWEGGAASNRLICKTPNDIIAMMEDGEVYSVTAAQTYGDYKAASLTRPAFMHRWIKEYCNLAYFNNFHMVFDPVLRAIKIFIIRNGQSAVDTALVYFIDRPAKEAWMVHDNQSSTSGYSASASCIYRKSAGVHKVYTGGYVGDIWELETANQNDDGVAFYGGFKTGHMPFDNPRIEKRYKHGFLITRPEGDYTLAVDWWVDGVQQTQRTVSLAGIGENLDAFVLGTSVLGGDDVIDTKFELGKKGKRVQLEVKSTTVNEDFYVSHMLIDHKELGAEPT